MPTRTCFDRGASFFLPVPSAEPKGLRSPSCCLHLLLQHLHTGRDIDQVSAVEEGPADQELLEEAIKLESIHLSVFKSFRLLEATGCILSHPVLAALSSHCKPNHLRKSSPFPGCSSDPNPSWCLAPGLGAVQIRGFSRAAFSPLQEPAADSTEVRLSNVVSQQCHVSSGGVISLVRFSVLQCLPEISSRRPAWWCSQTQWGLEEILNFKLTFPHIYYFTWFYIKVL